MARNPSAMKYHRQSEKVRLAHRAKKSTIRTFTKKAIAAAEAGDQESAVKYQRVAVSLIDKATKTNTFHKNKAARKKSRLMQHVNKRLAAQA
ncbi:MAG: 30S ribosomal protein S20 [Trueperaceae bacterium]|nr:30S ribosomal protein S20 [Trueperaceae bacterium]